MNLITATIMALIYNFGNMFGLYGIVFITEIKKLFGLL